MSPVPRVSVVLAPKQIARRAEGDGGESEVPCILLCSLGRLGSIRHEAAVTRWVHYCDVVKNPTCESTRRKHDAIDIRMGFSYPKPT